jgi:2-iminobutanoate/2-iminopropanoate deaminase
MSSQKAARHDFLRRGFGGMAAGAAGVALAAQPAWAKGKKPTRKVISRPGEKPPPTAMYGPGIQLGNLLFVSGQGARDFKTGNFPEGPFPNQVRLCLENVKAVLDTAGSSLNRVLKCTVYLVDIANFQAMNEVYHTYFATDPPARSTVAVKDLPGNSPVEIECIAYTD